MLKKNSAVCLVYFFLFFIFFLIRIEAYTSLPVPKVDKYFDGPQVKGLLHFSCLCCQVYLKNVQVHGLDLSVVLVCSLVSEHQIARLTMNSVCVQSAG